MKKTVSYAAFFLFTVIGMSAQAIDSGGLAPAECVSFHLSGPAVTSAKAVSKNRNEYHFTASGRVGLPHCKGTFTFGPYSASVAAAWDASTGEASEQISHGSSSSSMFIVTHVRAKCLKDPWQNVGACTLIYQSNTHPGSDLSGFSFGGPFPVTAGLLSSAQRKSLAATVTPYQDFALAPSTPPVIVSPVSDVIIRNGAPVIVQVKRPIDGSDKWYAEHPLQFEVQFQVYRDVHMSKGGAGPTAPLGPNWTPITPAILIGMMKLSSAPVSAPLNTFASQGPGSSGDWQAWRMRARLSDSMVTRPWSNWRPFNVVVPTTFTKMPDKPGGGLPSDAAKGKAPASKAVAPTPAAKPLASPIIVQPPATSAPAANQRLNQSSPAQRGTSQ